MADADIACDEVKRVRLPRPLDNKCTVCGFSPVKAKSLCDRHYRTLLRNGSPDLINRKQQTSICAWSDCDQQVRACGYCRRHYRIARREGLLKPGEFMRDHSLYSLWWARRKVNALSSEWKDDFQRFIADVGDRPGKHFNLVTVGDGPFGPDNFKWREQIKRQPGESLKAFHARKWQAQKLARPSWDRNRQLGRKYNLTPEQYAEMLADQGNLCAICRRPEKKTDHRLGAIKCLAVDHNHETGKVRGLLCSACNVTIGQIGESLEILRAMEAYLLKHQ